MAVDPAVPRTRRNLLTAGLAGLAGLVFGSLARPLEADATTGPMVYGTSMDAGVATTTLTAATSGNTAVFTNTGSGTAVEGVGMGAGPGIVGANTSTGTGVLGGSSSGNGIKGASTSGNGVQGLTTSGIGVNGISTTGLGVVGTSTSSVGAIGGSAATDQPGLYGQSTGDNTGVVGMSGGTSFALPSSTPAKTGVYGFANQDATAVGIRGASPQGTGVVATSTSGSAATASSNATDKPAILAVSVGNSSGIFAYSGDPFPAPVVAPNTGVYGLADQNPTAVGVRGESTSGTGVRGAGPVGVLGAAPVSGVGVYGSASGLASPTLPPAKSGVVGESDGGAGVVGFVLNAPTLPAVINGTGVLGSAYGGVGVVGYAGAPGTATPQPETGVFGQSTNGLGVSGLSASGSGVEGSSTSGSGVVGISGSANDAAVLGQSVGNGTGLLGHSGPVLGSPAAVANTGVYGVASQDATAVGVKGLSDIGTGVVGSSGGAIQAGIRALAPGNGTGLLGYSGPADAQPVGLPNTGVYGIANQDATAIGVEGDTSAGTGVLGHSDTGAGVVGWSGITAYAPAVGVAVFGANTTGGHDLYAGGSGRIGLAPNVASGPPTANDYTSGDVFCDAAGSLWVCVSSGSPGTFRKLAGPTTAGSLHPIAPARVYDSRLTDGVLTGFGFRTVSVAAAIAGGAVVPPGSTAVAYNLTITGTVGAGWLALVPHGAPSGGTSAINWFAAKQIVANGGIIGLGGDRQIDVHIGAGAGSATQFIVDVTGYYL